MGTEDQAWCRNEDGSVKYPIGSHRMKEDWHKERYDWPDDQGKPIQEAWTKSECCNKVNKWDEPEDGKISDPVIVPDKFTKDHEIVTGGKRLTVPVIDLDADQEDIFNAELLDGSLKTPKQRRLGHRPAFEKELEKTTEKRGKR